MIQRKLFMNKLRNKKRKDQAKENKKKQKKKQRSCNQTTLPLAVDAPALSPNQPHESRSKYPNVHVCAPCGYHATDIGNFLSRLWNSICFCLAVCLLLDRCWCPSKTGCKVGMRFVDRLHAPAVLCQVPAPDSLVVADGEKV